jgi:hypothetical protein
VIEKAGAFAPRYEEIDVTVRPGFAASNRTDQPHLRGTVRRSDPENRVAVTADCLSDAGACQCSTPDSAMGLARGPEGLFVIRRSSHLEIVLG